MLPVERDLLDGVAHVPGGDELALLDVDGAAGFAGGDEQVGLAAEEGGDLEDVDRPRRRGWRSARARGRR